MCWHDGGISVVLSEMSVSSFSNKATLHPPVVRPVHDSVSEDR